MAKKAAEPLRIEAIDRDTMHERIYAELRRALMSGGMTPGQVLSYRNLAEALGTSPMPVRDAVRRLIAERALVALPNRTIVVPEPTALEIEQLYKVRIALEGLAAEEAASHATEEDTAELEKLQREMDRQFRTGRLRQYAELNWRFHFKIYAMARMPQLESIIESCWLQIGPSIFHSLPTLTTTESYAEHDVAIAALRRRDGPAARAAIAQDLRMVGDALAADQRDKEARMATPASADHAPARALA